jgi:hypothetical protein
MRKKKVKRNEKQISIHSFIHSFFLSFFLLVISLAGSVRAQELRGFMYLYGEMGGDYFSDEKLINFRIGQIDLLSSLGFGRAEGYAELVVEEMIDVERLYFGYNFHKLFTLRVGRFHSPLGYFTREWHHGLYLMPTIRRPLIIEFEDFGGPLPIHSIGFEAEGSAEIGEFQPGYVINVGTGNLQFGASPLWDLDKEKTFIGKLFVKRGFGEIGVSLGYDPFRIQEKDGSQILVRNFILGGNLSYNNPGGLIALLEGFLLRDLESKKSGWGGFLILSYHVFGSELIYSIRPYLQIGTLDWQEGNPYFEKLQTKLQEEGEGGGYGARNLFNKHIEYSAGLRIGISPEFAVKIGFSFFDMKKIEDRYFISLSAGWGIPIFEK